MLCWALCGKAFAAFSGYPLAKEGAWCWFADPRALHYENENGTINASYVGYIDVHGTIKAVQVNFLTGERDEVLSLFAEAGTHFYEVLPLSLEEIFISETEVKGYDVKRLLLG